MENENNKLVFITDDGEEVSFEIIEETTLVGVNYLLVCTDEEEDDSEALILKDISKSHDDEAVYVIVEDDQELKLLANIFNELIDDIEIY